MHGLRAERLSHGRSTLETRVAENERNMFNMFNSNYILVGIEAELRLKYLIG